MRAYFSFDHSRWGQIISGYQTSGSNSVTDSSLLTSLHRVWSRQVYIIHRSITGFLVVQEATCTHAHEYRLLGASCYYYYYFYFWCHICACKFMHAYFSFNLLIWRQPFPVTGLPVLNSLTDSSRHTLLLSALHSQWSRQVYIRHKSITGFLMVQEPTCTHAHEYRLRGASCFFYFWCHICACIFIHAYLSFNLSRRRKSISGY